MRPAPAWLLPLSLLLLALPASARAGQVKLTQALRRETTTLATLESLTDWVVRSEQELAEVRFKQKQMEEQIADAERKRAAIEQRLRQHRQQVQLRVRGLYKMSRGGLLRLLLEAPDEQSLTGRMSAASLILRRDVREVGIFQKELRQLASERAGLEQARSQQLLLGQRLSAKQLELRQRREEQVGLLRKLQYSRRLQQSLAGELDGQQRALLHRIGQLAWRVRIAGGFASLRGKLPRPVGGPVTSIFGRPVEGTRGGLTILRHGFTYRPSQREAVHAVAEGLVRVAAPFEGYGKLVVVEHGDGYFSLYGFLGSIAVAEGQRVRRTAMLGRAGIDPLTGNTGTYFELRHGEQPLDPASWLRR